MIKMKNFKKIEKFEKDLKEIERFINTKLLI